MTNKTSKQKPVENYPNTHDLSIEGTKGNRERTFRAELSGKGVTYDLDTIGLLEKYCQTPNKLKHTSDELGEPMDLSHRLIAPDR